MPTLETLSPSPVQPQPYPQTLRIWWQSVLLDGAAEPTPNVREEESAHLPHQVCSPDTILPLPQTTAEPAQWEASVSQATGSQEAHGSPRELHHCWLKWAQRHPGCGPGTAGTVEDVAASKQFLCLKTSCEIQAVGSGRRQLWEEQREGLRGGRTTEKRPGQRPSPPLQKETAVETACCRSAEPGRWLL